MEDTGINIEIIHVVLTMQVHRVQKLWRHGYFYLDFKECPEEPMGPGRREV
jgi:hypothetical protein